MTSISMKRIAHLLLACSLLAFTGLAGCRENEENRQIKLEKGEYQGPADSELTEEQRRELQMRGYKQQF